MHELCCSASAQQTSRHGRHQRLSSAKARPSPSSPPMSMRQMCPGCLVTHACSTLPGKTVRRRSGRRGTEVSVTQITARTRRGVSRSVSIDGTLVQSKSHVADLAKVDMMPTVVHFVHNGAVLQRTTLPLASQRFIGLVVNSSLLFFDLRDSRSQLLVAHSNGTEVSRCLFAEVDGLRAFFVQVHGGRSSLQTLQHATAWIVAPTFRQRSEVSLKAEG